MKQKSNLIKAGPVALAKTTPKSLLSDVRGLILAARTQTAQAVNASLTLLYWQIGRRIRTDILEEKRAEYGEKIFYALSRKLTKEFGQGYSQANLFHMARFAEVFPDAKIVHALRAKLGWTHFRRIIYLNDPLKRDFYAEMCRIEKWNVRTHGTFTKAQRGCQQGTDETPRRRQVDTGSHFQRSVFLGFSQSSKYL